CTFSVTKRRTVSTTMRVSSSMRFMNFPVRLSGLQRGSGALCLPHDIGGDEFIDLAFAKARFGQDLARLGPERLRYPAHRWRLAVIAHRVGDQRHGRAGNALDLRERSQMFELRVVAQP